MGLTIVDVTDRLRRIARPPSIAAGLVACVCTGWVAPQAIAAAGQSASTTALVVDENVWVAFYDLPSRRFRTARDAFVRRDFVAAAQDLDTSAKHVRVAAQLASDAAIANALTGSAAALERLALAVPSEQVTINMLDEVFSQTHWRLTQLYLAQARVTRERRDDPLTGRYLLASAHHMERAVVWSNSRIEGRDVDALDAVRLAARRLAAGEPWANYRAARPIAQLQGVLERTGKRINRPLLLPK